VMFPALFAMGMDPAGGAGLVFVVLPSIFAKMPGGMIFGAGIFLLLSVAALTSTISLLEVPVAYFVDDHGWSRKKAVMLMGLITFIIGIPSALALGANNFLTTFIKENFGFLDFMNALFGNYSLSIGAFFIAIFAGYKWGITAVEKEIQEEGNIFFFRRVWAFLIRFICPIAIFIILAYIAWTGNYF
jgi:NSS family neurotransmitter:Na+ symporter